MITLHRVKEVPRQEWATTKVGQAMLPIDQLKSVDPDMELAGAAEHGSGRSEPDAGSSGSAGRRNVEPRRRHHLPAFTPGAGLRSGMTNAPDIFSLRLSNYHFHS